MLKVRTQQHAACAWRRLTSCASSSAARTAPGGRCAVGQVGPPVHARDGRLSRCLGARVEVLAHLCARGQRVRRPAPGHHAARRAAAARAAQGRGTVGAAGLPAFWCSTHVLILLTNSSRRGLHCLTRDAFALLRGGVGVKSVPDRGVDGSTFWPSFRPSGACGAAPPSFPSGLRRRGPSGGGGACRNYDVAFHHLDKKTRCGIAQSARISHRAACGRMLCCKRRSFSKDKACAAAGPLRRRVRRLRLLAAASRRDAPGGPRLPSVRPSGWMGGWMAPWRGPPDGPSQSEIGHILAQRHNP